jgi:hypothetical protein
VVDLQADSAAVFRAAAVGFGVIVSEAMGCVFFS